jgi:hypothetical protein
MRLLIAVLALCACQDRDFAAMQERGRMVMGVDQYTSAHVFEDLPDGGAAIHEFLAFQRSAHHAAGHEPAHP